MAGVEWTEVAGWGAVLLLIVLGLVGTVLPALPGTLLILGGIVLAAWLDDFTRIGPWSLGIVCVLALLAWLTDYLATVLGAKKAGASGLAILGAALGTVAGVFTGFVGLLFMPLLGAALGELIARGDAAQAGRVGLATWLGMVVGTLLKLVLSFMMIGVFIAALLID